MPTYLQAWFSQGLKGPWIRLIRDAEGLRNAPARRSVGALERCIGHIIGVIAAHLTWRWASSDVQRLSSALDLHGAAQMLVLDGAGVVVVGPRELRDAPWHGAPLDESPPIEPVGIQYATARRLPAGATVLVARAPVSVGDPKGVKWQVQLSEPRELVYQRANALALRILWISICLGLATALLGALGARHLTNRLRGLTLSAAAVGAMRLLASKCPADRMKWPNSPALYAFSMICARARRVAGVQRRFGTPRGDQNSRSGTSRRGVALCGHRSRAIENRARSA